MSEAIERVEFNLAELEALLARVREPLGEEVYQKLHAVLQTLAYLTRLVEDKKTTIARLRKLLFGARTDANYRAIWARDGAKTLIWTLDVDDADIRACQKATLKTILEH